MMSLEPPCRDGVSIRNVDVLAESNGRVGVSTILLTIAKSIINIGSLSISPAPCLSLSAVADIEARIVSNISS